MPSARQIIDYLIFSSARSAREEIMRQFDMRDMLCQVTIPPASNSYGPPRVYFFGPTDEDRNFRTRKNRYSTVPHPARCRNLASRPCTRTHVCVFLSYFAPRSGQLKLVCRRLLWVVR
jgi:hypothetical protein